MGTIGRLQRHLMDHCVDVRSIDENLIIGPGQTLKRMARIPRVAQPHACHPLQQQHPGRGSFSHRHANGPKGEAFKGLLIPTTSPISSSIANSCYTKKKKKGKKKKGKKKKIDGTRKSGKKKRTCLPLPLSCSQPALRGWRLNACQIATALILRYRPARRAPKNLIATRMVGSMPFRLSDLA